MARRRPHDVAPSAWAAATFSEPNRRQRLRELRALSTPVRLGLARLRRGDPRFGDGRAIVLYPGYGTGDRSLSGLANFLAASGHEVHSWGMGVNRGDLLEVYPHCRAHVRSLAAETGRPVNLVGWSMGGGIVRELVRDEPRAVHRAATLATPVYGPRYTLARRAFSEEELSRFDRELDRRMARPIERPTLSLYTRHDGVVDWRCCIDGEYTATVNSETPTATHMSMAFDPHVRQRLAAWFAAEDDPNPPLR